jgi:hypothetical protein
MKRSTIIQGTLLIVCSAHLLNAQETLRERLDDENGVRSDVWVYNDIEAAREQARKENKPVFVTFRCVPCEACAAFDADVAKGNDRIRQIAKEQFVSVRQVEMKGVDLSLFQFDHDLNWAAMFINADGTIYARYGTQSAEGPDAYNSIEGLLATMERVLELHKSYPTNKAQLVGKRGKRKIDSALKMPGLQNPAKYKSETTRKNCIHCHNIHDAENFQAQLSGPIQHDLLWRYPLPDQMGISIDRKDGVTITKVASESPAEKAGFQVGEKIESMNGQAMTSIADMQWALHHLPSESCNVDVIGSKTGLKTVALQEGWKEYDVSWRGSMWSVSPKLRVWMPILASAKRQELGIDDENTALQVKWINRGSQGGKGALASGLRQNDIVIAMEGRPLKEGMNPKSFNTYIKLNYQVGQELPLTVLRNGKKIDLKIKLVE